MNTNIQVFNNPEFGEIRTMLMPDGQIGFVGRDVAKVLGYNQTDKAINRHIEEDDRMKCTVTDSLGRKQMTTIINESGLYALILSSKLPKAREFKHWVTAEVLPQIRQTGGYLPVKPEDDDASIMARALLVAQRTLERKDEIIGLLQPKAQYSDEVLCSVSCLTVTQIAKELGMTGNALNRLLCQKGIQYAQSGQYLLYADYARRELAQNRTHMYTNASGQTVTRTYLVWTEAGRDFIHRLVG